MSISIANDQNYRELIGEGFVIVDFYSDTCMPCKIFSLILEKLAAERPFINIVKVNVADCPKLRADNNIEAVPTVLFIKDGEEKEQTVGLMDWDELIGKTDKYC